MRGRFAGICSFTMCSLQDQIKTYQRQVGEFKYKIDIQTCNSCHEQWPSRIGKRDHHVGFFSNHGQKRDWNEVGVPLSVCLRSHQSRCSNVKSLSRTVDHVDFEDLACVFSIVNCVDRTHFRDRCIVILYWFLCGGRTGCSLHWISIWQISLQAVSEQTWG